MAFDVSVLKELTAHAGLISALVVLHSAWACPPAGSQRVRYAMAMGSAYAVAAIVSMLMPLTIERGVLIDIKTVLMALAGAYLPPLGAALALLVACAFRGLALAGQGALVGIAAMVTAAALGLGYRRLRQQGRLSPGSGLLVLGALTSVTALLWVLLLPGGLGFTLLPQLVLPVPLVFCAAILLFGQLVEVVNARTEATQSLRATMEALRLSERRLALALEASGDGMVEWDTHTGALHQNANSFRQLGYEPGEFSASIERLTELVHPEDRDARERVFDLYRQRPGVPFSFEFRRRMKDGSYRWFLSRGQFFSRDEQGLAPLMIATSSDIHEAKTRAATLEQLVAERTDELRRANEDLARARDAAEAAARAKSEFLANMSHEIRTPMNAVLGLTDLALRGELSGKQRAYLEKTQLAASSLLAIINDILDFSKIEAGRLELERREFALQSVLDRVVAVVSLSAQQKGLRLTIGTAPAVPPLLLGDALRLEQVLINLCGNAVKFTAHGEVALRVDCESDAEAGRVVLRFSVTDTGIGIGPAQLGKLFRPFMQVDASTTRQFGGSGLGLAICRQLVELMGGSIGVRSEVGKGSEFHFTAEFGRVAARAEAAPGGAANVSQGVPAEAAGEAPAVLRGKPVLLVEDNELNQLVAIELLESIAGMSVALASDGQQAVQMATESEYAAILMDVQMPVMDGYDATRAIRARNGARRLPIIGMTANALAGDRQLCLSAGMDDYITKPFEPAELFAVLARWIEPEETAHPERRAGVEADTGGVDFDEGLYRCLGRQELYSRIVERFVATRAADADQLREALSRGDLLTARTLAHSLTSTGGAIGAMRLSRLARQLERDVLDGAAEATVRANGQALALEHERVVHELNAYCNLRAERIAG